jgi:hypothetical protein
MFKYRSFPHALYTIAAEEGWRALFKGSVARMCFHIPMTAIAMTTVEQVKPMLFRAYPYL